MKRFQLPLRKGTELLPSTSQQPTKLIIRGVPPGSPLFSEVVATYAGQLKQFHGRQQQAYSLSSLPTHKARIDLGGAIATYSNINGQEILELEVSIPVLEQLKEKVKQITPNTYLLVEMEIDNTLSLDGFGDIVPGNPNIFGAAWLRSPQLSQFRGGQTDAAGSFRWFPGFSADEGAAETLGADATALPAEYEIGSHLLNSSVQFAFAENFDGDVPLEYDSVRKTNFLVYMPRDGSHVAVDVYAYAWRTGFGPLAGLQTKCTVTVTDTKDWQLVQDGDADFLNFYWRTTGSLSIVTQASKMFLINGYTDFTDTGPGIPMVADSAAPADAEATIDWPYITTVMYDGDQKTISWVQVPQVWT